MKKNNSNSCTIEKKAVILCPILKNNLKLYHAETEFILCATL